MSDKPEWMGTVDFGGLKLKLVSSIVAISGIHLLKIFFGLEKKLYKRANSAFHSSPFYFRTQWSITSIYGLFDSKK